MSNVHIMTLDGNEVRVVMHFAIPATANTPGVPWQTIAARFYGTTTLPDGDGTGGTISSTEKASIVSGALVESAQTLKIGTSTPTGAQIDAAFNAAQTAFLVDLQSHYARYGTVR